MEVWGKLKPLLIETLGRQVFDTYFTHLEPIKFEGNTLYLKTPFAFIKTWITTHYKTIVEELLSSLEKKTCFIQIESPEDTSKSTQSHILRQKRGIYHSKRIFSPEYQFNNFIVGPSNQFAFAAAKAIVEKPGTQYNPLLIYGDSGLGKTHLIQAIGNALLDRHPHLKIFYLTGEQFINRYVDALSKNRMKSFQKLFRDTDVFLLDDIHFLAGKSRSSEEFFHTFNALYQSQCQLVFTSDRPPKEITAMEPRLRTRLEWGLLADISPPNFETRLAILKHKTQKLKLSIPEEVLHYIAELITTNIRELEGALLKVSAMITLMNQEPSLQLVQKILKEYVPLKTQTFSPTVKHIQQIVAQYYGISIEDLRSSKRTKNLVLPRHIAMYLSRRLTSLSLPEISSAFGRKDHVSVLYAHKKISTLIQENKSLKEDIQSLQRLITEKS